jgi:hypothetical protein
MNDAGALGISVILQLDGSSVSSEFEFEFEEEIKGGFALQAGSSDLVQ